MPIKILDKEFDRVIKSDYITAKTTYSYALENLVPLINRLDLQRNTLPQQYYTKLQEDILNGCIMPPLTIALKNNSLYNLEVSSIEDFINQNIKDAFVLDGIQRLNTLKKADPNKLEVSRPLYLNIIISNSMDKLLYRMITLNNGQRPMSARHQVEILASNLYDFENLNINLISEKDQGKKRLRGAFKKNEVIKAYLAFISNSINIDNQKIIASKLDELITDQIIESDLTEREIEFSDVIDMINNFMINHNLKKWFTMENNLIGFCSGISKQFDFLTSVLPEEFEENITKFEEAFSFINVSKVKLGLARRKAVNYFIQNYSKVKEMSLNKLTDVISQEV